MSDDILFGAAYYAEYMPYDRIEKDIALMKKAGMNTIRIAESTWSTEEPRDGVFDFSFVDKVLDVLEKNNMHAIIGTPTYAVPSWLIKKDPTIMVTRKEGQALYGPRQSMDILNPTFLFHAERIIRKLIGHVASCPAVCGFQIDNETKHYGNYGPYAQKAFKEYLRETYGSVESFNKAFGLAYWSNSLGSWNDFPDLRGCINGNLICEYEKFLRRCAAQYLQWQANIVSEYKRQDQLVTHNFDFEWNFGKNEKHSVSHSYGVQPEINHAEASRALTIAGVDIYHPSQNELTGKEIAFCGDEARSLKQKNYLVMETEAQAFKQWTPYPGQLRLQAYSHLASGADGMMYWSWQSIHNSFETYWKGLLSHDLEPNAVFEEAKQFAAEWKKFGQKIVHLQKKNDVALVIDNNSLTALKLFPIDEKLSYNDIVRWMYDSLFEMNIECDVVDIHELDPTQYRMIITPALYCISEESISMLFQFVKDGGILISSFKSFFTNEHATVYQDMQPHMMTTCFGMHYQQFVLPENMSVQNEPCSYFAELLMADSAKIVAPYKHAYWNMYACITKNKVGKGTAYYIGSYTEKKVLKKLYQDAAKCAKLKAPSSKWPVIMRSGIDGKGKKLHYVFNYSSDKKNFICPFANAVDLLTGEAFAKDKIITLHDWDVKIFEEQ